MVNGLGICAFSLIACSIVAIGVSGMSAEFAADMCITRLSITATFLVLLLWGYAGWRQFSTARHRLAPEIVTTALIVATPIVPPVVVALLELSCEPGYVPPGPILGALGWFAVVPIGLSAIIFALASSEENA